MDDSGSERMGAPGMERTGGERVVDKSPLVDVDDERGRVLIFDSATYVGDFYSQDARKGADVVVNASYSGVYCARLVSRHAPKAAIGVDCGIGKDGAGIAGLWFYEALGIPAAAAGIADVELGNGEDLYRSGKISRVNELARLIGVEEGMPVREAALMMLDAADKPVLEEQGVDRLVVETSPEGRSVVCIDSIADASPEDYEKNVLCTAGHTGRSVIGYITDFRPWGFICSDGGRGKNDSGLVALWAVEEQGIAGATVDANTARMGDGRSTYFDGVISACNEPARRKGVEVGQTAKEAAHLLLAD
jgi:hypothetical protein